MTAQLQRLRSQFADFRVLYQARCQRRLPAPARWRPRPAAQLQPPSLPAKQQHTSKHAAELAKQHSDAVNGMEQLLWWDAASRRLVWLATLALLGDTILRAAAQAVAEPPLLTSAMWLPLASNLTSYLILSSTFVADGEHGAAACYMAGLACTLGLLAQIYHLDAVPVAVFWPAAALAAASMAANSAKLAGWLDTAVGAAAWRLWRGVVGCAGWAMLPQIAYLSLVVPPSAVCCASWGPAAVSIAGGAALLALTAAGLLPTSWRRSWDIASWTATLLFMLEPLSALVAAARDSSILLALSPTDFLLPALATGLQVPRALLRDHMWLTGTSWATVFACLQAAIVAAAHGELANAAAALAAPLLCSAWLLQSVARAQGHNAPLQALGPAAAAYQREARTWGHVAAHLRRRWLIHSARTLAHVEPSDRL